MDNTTKQILLFENSRFYLLSAIGRQELSQDQLNSLRSGYALLISDTELFYTTMEFPEAPKRRVSMFISNYLMGSFPQNMCENFCYIRKDDKILIGIFNSGFTEKLPEIERVFARASLISSPFAKAYIENDSFTYTVSGAGLKVIDGLLENSDELAAGISADFEPSHTAKLSLPFIRKGRNEFSEFRIPALILLVCYLFFTSGEYFRMKSSQKKLESYEKALDQVYQKAGVSDSRDPYGKLLSKSKGADGKTYETLFLLEMISRASNEKITARVLEAKGKSIIIQGTSTDFTDLEEFKRKLSAETGKSVEITDTAKKDNEVTFSLRFAL